MLSDEEFRKLLTRLDRPWAGFRKVRKGVKKRVRRHLESLGCASVEAYLDRLVRDPSARAECERCLIVTISRFFRDRRLWDHLQTNVLPVLMERFPQGLVAWSAGCACGEEPYSLALIWDDWVASRPSAPALQILATDTLASGLERARQGLYPQSSLEEVPAQVKNRWFHKAPGARQWRIHPDLYGRIIWQIHPLFAPPPSGPFQLIFLRNNLLTYYQGAAMETALERILETLAPGGILILGSHEKLPGTKRSLIRDAGCPWIYWDKCYLGNSSVNITRAPSPSGPPSGLSAQ